MTETKNNKNESEILSAISNSITKLNAKVESIESKLPEIILLILAIVAHFVICAFHEPWYDEAVAWMVARFFDVKSILFEIGHYEGHPQLWYFLLLPFAKLGVPYELSLSIISGLFTTVSTYIILFRSPFPRLVRWILPFTYFYFYQYGVIARPYCIMMVAFLLIAMTYKNRDEKPLRHVLALLMLVCTSAYGIAIAGCIALVWVLKITWKKKFSEIINMIVHDKRAHSLIILLILSLIQFILIMPRDDTYASAVIAKLPKENGVIARLWYMLFVLPMDITFTNVYDRNKFLIIHTFETYELILVGIIGIALISMVMYCAKKKQMLLELLVPYVGFAVAVSITYFARHHQGVLFLLFVYWVYITLDVSEEDKKIGLKLNNTVKQVTIIISALAIVISTFWTVSASIIDVNYIYGIGRNESQFIKDHNLMDYNIMAMWFINDMNEKTDKKDENNEENIDKTTFVYFCSKLNQTNGLAYVDNMIPYFDNNIFYNFMDGENGDLLIEHKVYTKEENWNVMQSWKEKGYPDVLLGTPEINELWKKDEISIKDDYALVYLLPTYMIWKYEKEVSWSEVYVRRDLLEELELEELKVNTMLYSEDSYYKVKDVNNINKK